VILAVFGAARTVLGLFTEVVIALGRTRHLLLMQVAWLVSLILALIVCVDRWGILGAGIAHAVVVTVVAVPVYLVVLRRDPRVELRTLRSCVIVPLSASVVAGVAAFLVALPVGGDVWKLVAGLAAGLVVYVLIAGRWTLQLWRTLRGMYWQRQPVAAPADGRTEPLVRVSVVQDSQTREP
jgi:O-antigen/teichoic acid export membrane protein